MGTTSSTSRKGQTECEPAWVKTVQVPLEFALDQMGSLSDGFTATGPYSVVRSRTGHFDSDAIRWGRGFTSGKHVFEINYPVAERGVEATVGVGTANAPLYAKGKVPLVGLNRESWGISLRTKRAFHRNAIVKKYPLTQVQLPDKFYMYLDADAGLIKFGTDLDYYGTACNNIPKDQPIYPMASSTAHGANIVFIYRGQGSNMPPPSMVVIVTHTQPPPPPYETEKQDSLPSSSSTQEEKAPLPETALPAEEKAQE